MDAERLLGGLLKMSLGRSMKMGKKLRRLSSGAGMSTGTQAAIGMGALGVAMAAFEHFTGQSQASPTYRPAVSSPGYRASPATPPPPPPGAQPASAPPPPPGAKAETSKNDEAILMIRAMIAAANADGSIDAEERRNILDQFEESGLSDEERSFVLQEFLSPASLETIANQATTPELAKEIYMVSCLVIDADTEVERDYLKTLAQRLALHEDTVQQIHAQLGE